MYVFEQICNLNVLFTHKDMFTNWLNNSYIILIISPSNFWREYCSPSYNHFMNNYIVFLTSTFLCWARSLFILKLAPRILPSMFFNPTSLSWLSSSPLIWWSWLICCYCCPRYLTSLVCYDPRYHFHLCHLFYLLQWMILIFLMHFL